MEGQPAFFNCTLALCIHPRKYIFEGILHGKLTYPPRGQFGFGYDPFLFQVTTKKP